MIHEIAPDVYRISEFVPEINLEFSHFLVRDEEPLLFHAGLRKMFPVLFEEVGKLINPLRLRHVSFSHFEADECGALNEWLTLAPEAKAACGLLGAMVSVSDFARRPPRVLGPGEWLETGRYKFRFIHTPHVPHGWDAGLLFEETQQTLFCSDLFHQWGRRAPVTEASLGEAARDALAFNESGPFAQYVPYTRHTGNVLKGLAGLEPRTLAVMHGSSFRGDCASEQLQLDEVFREVLSEDHIEKASSVTC